MTTGFMAKLGYNMNDKLMKEANLETVVKAIKKKIGETGKSIEEICAEKGVNGHRARNYRHIIDGETKNPGYNTVLEMSRIFGCNHFFICLEDLAD